MTIEEHTPTTEQESSSPSSSLPTPQPPIPPMKKVARRVQSVSRRHLALGAAAAGLATAGIVGAQQAFTHQQNLANQNNTDITSQSSGGFSNLTPRAQHGHLLRRCGFGLTPEEHAIYQDLSYEQVIDRLLDTGGIDDSEMEKRINELKLDLNKPQDQQRWWLLRMAWTKRPLLEKMTLFWHGLLTSSVRKVGGTDAYIRMIVQNKFLRDHAFDRYDVLLKGITTDPAMLVYLDLNRSRKKAPNENYARELMELFTIGVGNYTQEDVKQAAVALTGWHVSGISTTSTFVQADFTSGNKTFLGQTGNFGVDDIIRILANHPATPRLLCKKLFAFFAYENPSEEDIEPMVTAYRESNHSIAAVLKAMFLSRPFRSTRAYRSRVKSPVEFVVGVFRSLGGNAYNGGLGTVTTALGQTLFNPPNVAGWPGDKVSGTWVNSGTWMVRMNFAAMLVSGVKRSTYGPYEAYDVQKTINTYKLESPEHFIDFFASFLLDGEIYNDRRAILLDYLNMPERGTAKVTFPNGKSYPLSRVRGALYLLLASPDYQLN